MPYFEIPVFETQQPLCPIEKYEVIYKDDTDNWIVHDLFEEGEVSNDQTHVKLYLK